MPTFVPLALVAAIALALRQGFKRRRQIHGEEFFSCRSCDSDDTPEPGHPDLPGHLSIFAHGVASVFKALREQGVGRLLQALVQQGGDTVATEGVITEFHQRKLTARQMSPADHDLVRQVDADHVEPWLDPGNMLFMLRCGHDGGLRHFALDCHHGLGLPTPRGLAAFFRMAAVRGQHTRIPGAEFQRLCPGATAAIGSYFDIPRATGAVDSTGSLAVLHLDLPCSPAREVEYPHVAGALGNVAFYRIQVIPKGDPHGRPFAEYQLRPTGAKLRIAATDRGGIAVFDDRLVPGQVVHDGAFEVRITFRPRFVPLVVGINLDATVKWPNEVSRTETLDVHLSLEAARIQSPLLAGISGAIMSRIVRGFRWKLQVQPREGYGALTLALQCKFWLPTLFDRLFLKRLLNFEFINPVMSDFFKLFARVFDGIGRDAAGWHSHR